MKKPKKGQKPYSNKYLRKDDSEEALRLKLKNLEAELEELNEKLDTCESFESFVEIRRKRGDLQYHINISIARINDDYKIMPIAEV